MDNFQQYNFYSFINETLADLNINKPTLVQKKVIPFLLKNKSVICQAHTGTGKTLAFLLPILQNTDFSLLATQAIIIVPTRELANQIYKTLQFFSKHQPFHVANLIGGEDINLQIKQLNKYNPQIIVATPVRLKELFDRQFLNFKHLKTIILDECDMIIDLGFLKEIDYLLSKISPNIKTSVFSATIPEKFQILFTKYFNQPILLTLDKEKPTNENITHILIPTKHQERGTVLLKLLSNLNPYLAIIFVNKKSEIEYYYNLLLSHHYSVCQIHSGLPPRVRNQTIKRIKNLEFKYVIASDMFARGIDIDGVSHVISIDLPYDLNYYIHRSGRTGRGKYQGYSYVLYDTKNQFLVDELKKQHINFKIKKWNANNELVDIPTLDLPKNKKIVTDPEALKIINKYPTKKNKKIIKPGYRKKRKAELEELKNDRRRKHIKESIKKIKKVKAQERAKRLFNNDNKN